MITKFIGSAEEFINCTYVGFVMVQPGVTLIESNIRLYTYDYVYFYKKPDKPSPSEIVNGESVFRLDAKSLWNESNRFILNYLIMYDVSMSPLGYVNLAQDIDVYEYGIETITISLDYTVQLVSVTYSMDPTYAYHLTLTKDKTAHSKLFDNTLLEDKAVTKSNIVNFFNKKQSYTRNLRDIVRSENLITRYSGSLISNRSDNLIQLGFKSNYITKNEFDNSIFQEIISKNNRKYLLLVIPTDVNGTQRNNLYIYDMGLDGELLNGSRKNLNITSFLHLGSNLIVSTEYNGEFKLYSTDDLLHSIGPNPSPIHSYNNRLESKGATANGDLVITNFKFTKNPITKEIYAYYKNNRNQIVSYSDELSSILSEFGDHLITGSIIYASRGLLITGEVENDVLDLTGETINYYTYQLPGKVYGIQWSQFFNDIEDTTASNEKSVEFRKILAGINIQDIAILTPNLLFVNKGIEKVDYYLENPITTMDSNKVLVEGTSDPIPSISDIGAYYINHLEYKRVRGENKYLIEVAGDYSYKVGDTYINQLTHELKIYQMMGTSGVNNYEKILKSIDSKVTDLDILPLAIDGNLCGVVEVDYLYKLTSL